MRFAIASGKSINIHISKYLMAVRNCINILVTSLTKDMYLLTRSYIGELRNGAKLKCENKPFIVFILIFGRVLFKICFYFKCISNLQPLERIRHNPKLKHRFGRSLS